MVMIRQHCNITPEKEKDLKDIIKSVGGTVNQSNIFLSTTSTATSVTEATGVNGCLVVFIPHCQVGTEFLDAGNMN